MDDKIPLPNTSSTVQREGIHGRILRNNAQELCGEEETHCSQKFTSNQYDRKDTPDHRKHDKAI
eukprot:11405510-Ditylum_brightwellii.AAC.1